MSVRLVEIVFLSHVHLDIEKFSQQSQSVEAMANYKKTPNLETLILTFLYISDPPPNNLNIEVLFTRLQQKSESLQNMTRGPRGPWVAHLRKRSKVTVEPIIENPRGII